MRRLSSNSERDFQTSACISHLIAESVSADCYGLSPPRNEAGDVFTQDRLTENCSAQNIPDGSIWALPHLF